MALKDFLGKTFSKDEDFLMAQKERKIQKILDEREKNTNERELERFAEEGRQEEIKNQLNTLRKQKQSDFFKSNMFFDKGKTNILKNDNKILKIKKMTKKNLFFK